MSQRISELEKAVGVPLVRRTTRSMRLTGAGERLVSVIKTSYDAIAEASREPRMPLASVKGSFTSPPRWPLPVSTSCR